MQFKISQPASIAARNHLTSGEAHIQFSIAPTIFPSEDRWDRLDAECRVGNQLM
jgi:hypothetical protein